VTTAPTQARTGVLFLESTTGSHAALVVDSDDRREVFRLAWTRAGSRQDNLDDLVGTMPADDFALLSAIVVDVGPGNLATTRACVAYANALAFSTGLSMGAVDSLEVMAQMAGPVGGTVLAVRRAGPHGFYSRTRRADGRVEYSLLDAEALVAAAGGADVVVHPSEADGAAVEQAGVDLSRARLLTPTVDAVRDVWIGESRVADARVLEPLTETASRFHGSAADA
jgi:tRNA A37 threonylcarbamoyladenosine modification protein TsaB